MSGVWNNYEGLPHNYTERLDQVLGAHTDYQIKVSGKTDWSTGGHTLNVRLGAWMMNAKVCVSLYLRAVSAFACLLRPLLTTSVMSDDECQGAL